MDPVISVPSIIRLSPPASKVPSSELYVPPAGAEISAGQTVVLYTGARPDETQTVVPDLIGLTFEEAINTLERAGLYMMTADLYTGNEEAIIWKQSAQSGVTVDSGSVIEVALAENVDEGIE